MISSSFFTIYFKDFFTNIQGQFFFFANIISFLKILILIKNICKTTVWNFRFQSAVLYFVIYFSINIALFYLHLYLALHYKAVFFPKNIIDKVTFKLIYWTL